MSLTSAIKTELSEFFSKSSVQGLSNVADGRQHGIVRTLWFIIVVFVFVLAGICTKQSIDGK